MQPDLIVEEQEMSNFTEVSKFEEIVITHRRQKISSAENVSKNASAPNTLHIKSKIAKVEYEFAMEKRSWNDFSRVPFGVTVIHCNFR